MTSLESWTLVFGTWNLKLQILMHTNTIAFQKASMPSTKFPNAILSSPRSLVPTKVPNPTIIVAITNFVANPLPPFQLVTNLISNDMLQTCSQLLHFDF